MSTDLAIRPAKATDGPAIWHILQPIFRAGDTYTIDPDIAEADAVAYWMQARCYVVEAKGVVLGTYYLKPNQAGGGAHVCNCGFATAAEARGKGVARAMLEHALAEARRVGFRAMQFNFVVASNTRAIAIWERRGFDVVGRLPGAFKHPDQGYVDALVMWKDLTDGTS